MKNINRFLLFIVSLFIYQIGYCQLNPELITKFERKYYYQGNVYYPIKELGAVLKSNPKAFRVHKRFISGRKVHRTLSLLSTGVLVRWAIWNGKRERCGTDKTCYDPDYVRQVYDDLVSAIVVGVSSAVIVLSAIPVYGKKKKAINIFNESVSTAPDIGAIPPSLNFQATFSGIGVVLNF